MKMLSCSDLFILLAKKDQTKDVKSFALAFLSVLFSRSTNAVIVIPMGCIKPKNIENGTIHIAIYSMRSIKP